MSDNIDYVFLWPSNQWPYRIKSYDGGLWLFCWHKHTKGWCSVRPSYDAEVRQMMRFALPPERAELYGVVTNLSQKPEAHEKPQ